MAILNALQGLVINLSVWFNRHIRIAVDVTIIYINKKNNITPNKLPKKALIQKKKTG
jgi:hypothetical protein